MHSAFWSLPKNFDKSEIGSYVLNGKNTVMIQMNTSLADVEHRRVCLLVLVVEFTRTVCATSRMGVPEARQTCAGLLETFTQSFVHCA